ncbi:MAG: hypothetical protein AB7O67_06535 [Vicinamibacterales bacterium]
MNRHADFLALLYLAWGALFALVGLAGLALGYGAHSIAQSGGPVDVGSGIAASLTAFTFFTLAGIALLWGALHLWVGTVLRRRRAWARLFGLGLAFVNLVLIPFGTALGAYALWVLLTDEGRRLFADGIDERREERI